jgi:hypothetical protein
MAKGTYHRVRDGQDLVFLAEWYYGDSTAWTHIYYANLDIYGDDFEMIPAANDVFIPDLEVSDIVESYTGPAVPARMGTQRLMRIGSIMAAFRIETETTGEKFLILTFEGEKQQAE